MYAQLYPLKCLLHAATNQKKTWQSKFQYMNLDGGAQEQAKEKGQEDEDEEGEESAEEQV